MLSTLLRPTSPFTKESEVFAADGVIHFSPLATVESGVKNVSLAPTVNFVAVELKES